jgi:outer membrane biosynthesis protein TonB
MRWGLGGSLALHAAIAVLVIGVFPFAAPDLPPIPPNIPVELVTIGEVTNIKQIDKVAETPKEETKPAEPEPEPQRQAAIPPMPEAKPAPEPEPMPAPPPPPEAKPEPQPAPKPEVKKVEEKKPEAKPVQVAPPPKKEQAFDASKIAALLNKLPTKSQTANQGEEKKLSTGPQKTEAVGAATGMTVSALDAIRAQMQRCWSLPAGAPNPQDLIVTLRFGLNADGTLARQPEIADQAKMMLGDGYYRAAAESAVRALQKCQPFKVPADSYNADWQDIEMTFDPRRMLGG